MKYRQVLDSARVWTLGGRKGTSILSMTPRPGAGVCPFHPSAAPALTSLPRRHYSPTEYARSGSVATAGRRRHPRRQVRPRLPSRCARMSIEPYLRPPAAGCTPARRSLATALTVTWARSCVISAQRPVGSVIRTPRSHHHSSRTLSQRFRAIRTSPSSWQATLTSIRSTSIFP